MNQPGNEVIIHGESSIVPVPQVEALIQLAIQKKVPVENLERLLAMRRELKAEQAKEAFDRAMAAFQSECPTIKKTKVVKTNDGKLAYKYAPIDSIVEQVRDSLKNNGFSYSTNMVITPGGVKVSVKVTHSAGHSEITEMEVPLGTKTAIMSQSQVVAAASTFAKRYAFCNAFGILTGDEDNDGASFEKSGDIKVTNNFYGKTGVRSDQIVHAKTISPATNGNGNGNGYKVTPKQIAFIHNLFSQKNTKGRSSEKIYTVEDLKEEYQITSMTQLTGDQASQIISNLMKLPDKPIQPKPDEDNIDIEEVDKGIEEMRKK